MVAADPPNPDLAEDGAPAAASVIPQLRYPSLWTGWLTVAVLFALYILSFVDRYIVALQVDAIKAGLRLTDFQMGLLQGPAFAVLYALCAIPVGLALDRYSRRLVLFVSIVVWSLAAAGCGLTTSFGVLLLARALLGAGQAGFGTGSYSIIGDSFPPARLSVAMSVYVMGGVMGAGIVFLLGGPLVREVLEAGASTWPLLGTVQAWQKVFLYTGAPGVLLAFLVFIFREPGRHGASKPGSRGYGEALRFIVRHPSTFASIFLGFGLVFSMTIAIQQWSPAYFGRVYHWRPDQIGVRLGIAQILAALTLPLHGMIVARLMHMGFKDAPLLWCLLTCVIALPLALAAFLVHDGWISIVLLGLYFTCVMSSASMGPAAVQLVTPTLLRGRISALYVMTTGLIGMSVGTSVVGLFTDTVFADPRRVGDSLIATVFLVMAPGLVLFGWGRAGLRRTMTEGAATTGG